MLLELSEPVLLASWTKVFSFLLCLRTERLLIDWKHLLFSVSFTCYCGDLLGMDIQKYFAKVSIIHCHKISLGQIRHPAMITTWRLSKMKVTTTEPAVALGPLSISSLVWKNAKKLVCSHTHLCNRVEEIQETWSKSTILFTLMLSKGFKHQG